MKPNKRLKTLSPSTSDQLPVLPNPSSANTIPMSQPEIKVDALKKSNCFKCPTCFYISNLRRDIVRHLRLKHKDYDVLVMPPEDTTATLSSYSNDLKTKKKTTAKYICDNCPYTGQDRIAYSQHHSFHAERENYFKCVSCPFWVLTKSKLAHHRKLHVPESFFEFHRVEDDIVPGSACRWISTEDRRERNECISPALDSRPELACMYCNRMIAYPNVMKHIYLFI